MTRVSQRLCYTVSWSLANVTSVDQDYVTKTFSNATGRVKNVDIDEWERLTDDRNKWRFLITERLRESENNFFRRQNKKTKEPE